MSVAYATAIRANSLCRSYLIPSIHRQQHTWTATVRTNTTRPIGRPSSLSLLSTKTMSATSRRSSGSSNNIVSDDSEILSAYASAPRKNNGTAAEGEDKTEKKQTPTHALERPTPSTSLFFVCDIQETFRDKMHLWNLMLSASAFMTKMAVQLDIPIFVTEQKPFKPTVQELGLDAIDHTLYTKTMFSMLTPSVQIDLQENHPTRKHIFLYGIETHVCVLQTTLDLLRHGYHVYLPLDAITSMHAVDREYALMRFQSIAALSPQIHLSLTSVESVMFELIADASKPEFKKMIPQLKEYAMDKKKYTDGTGREPEAEKDKHRSHL